MSLLLDAMKKSGQGAQSTGLTLEEAPAAARASAPPDETARAAGQNLFAAKKKAPPRRRWKLGLVPTTLLICGTIGAGYGYYVWRELNPPVQRVAVRNPPPPPSQPPKQVITPTPLVAAIKPEAPVQLEPQTPAAVPSAVAPAEEQAVPVESPRKVQRKSTASSAKRLTIRSATQADTITPALQDAWRAYQRGDYAAAEEGYRRVLAQDARNRDALLGMGAIAQQAGKDQAAQQYYRQVLVLDPRDPVALGAMSAFDTPNSDDAEVRLRQMLADQPRSAALHYALGNLYLDQSRWAEAQQAFFTALALEPGNPQFSYNLAVSLDHLGQGKLAADYYRQALQLDPSGLSGFDAAQTQRRLNELSATR